MSAGATPPILLFDGECGFCRASAHWIERRFSHGERAIAWQSLEVGRVESLGLSLRDVGQAAWWLDGRGGAFRGHRAIGMALGAGHRRDRLLGWFIRHAPTRWLAAALYAVIVRIRHRLPGATRACRVR